MKTLTTGEVAKLLKVGPRTVSNWCDSGRLEAYRIPGRSHIRKISREQLEKFLTKYNLPAEDIEQAFTEEPVQ